MAHRKHDHDGWHPIDTLEARHGYVLVTSGDHNLPNPGSSNLVLAAKEGNIISPMFSGGAYMGARWWREAPVLPNHAR